jgi:hypothetical protein
VLNLLVVHCFDAKEEGDKIAIKGRLFDTSKGVPFVGDTVLYTNDQSKAVLGTGLNTCKHSLILS